MESDVSLQSNHIGDAISYFSYVDNTVLSLDPFCVSKKTDADRFGRLLDVWENQTSWSGTFVNKVTPACSIGFSVQPTYQTTYTYDALDDLQTVSQSGLSPRTFTYDTLKRLVQAKNPESNTISYSYDGSNNLATRKDAVRTLTFGAYDGMNRVTSKSYSDSITSPVSYTYDTGSCNALGRLVSVTAGSFVNNYTCYDTMGRIKNSSQVVGSTPYPFSYTYDISGALATETYPSGRVVTNAFDAAGRISGVTGSIAPSAYASNVTYAPQGPISGLNLGSGMTEAWTFNSREQPITLKVNTTGLPLNLGWGYGAAANNNGNVQSQTISGPGLGGLTLTQNYTYDAVNRLWTFAETGSTGTQTYNTNQNYNYDSFGNRWLTSSWIAPGMSGQTPTSDAFTNNQWGLNGVNGYDGAGNQTSIAGVNRTFYYDGENRQIMAVIGNPSTATTYNYDGEGRRVQKITTSGTTTYVYDAMGHLAAEYGGSSTSAGRVYLSVDALGSTRLVTDASGNPTEQYDYAPFGEELTQGIDGRVALYSTNQYPTTPDAVTEKFTSKERDAETGFDFFDARYYSAAQGRFTSPDEFKGGFLDAFTGQAAFQPGPLPYADLSDPQTLNKYSYVRNNPLRYIDPTGHDHEGAFGLVRDWMDVVEVKGSAGMSIGTSGQAGSVEYRAEATLIGVEAKTGLGGGNSEAKATTGVVFAGKAGPLAGTVKAGAQISSNGGPGAEISGEVGAGGAAVKVGVKSDANGVQAASTPNASADVKFGAEARLGVGVGIAINLSQLGRAAARTVDAARDTVQAAREFVAKKLQETVIIP